MSMSQEEQLGGSAYVDLPDATPYQLPIQAEIRVWYFDSTAGETTYFVKLPQGLGFNLEGWLYYFVINRTDGPMTIQDFNGTAIGSLSNTSCMYIGLRNFDDDPGVWVLRTVTCDVSTDLDTSLQILAFGDGTGFPPNEPGGDVETWKYDWVGNTWTLGTNNTVTMRQVGASVVDDSGVLRALVRTDTSPGDDTWEYRNDVWIARFKSGREVEAGGMTFIGDGASAPGFMYSWKSASLEQVEIYNYTLNSYIVTSGPTGIVPEWEDTNLATPGIPTLIYFHSGAIEQPSLTYNAIYQPSVTTWFGMVSTLNGQIAWAPCWTGCKTHDIHWFNGNGAYRYVVPYARTLHSAWINGEWSTKPDSIRGQEMGVVQKGMRSERLIFGQGGQYRGVHENPPGPGQLTDPEVYEYDDFSGTYTSLAFELWKNRRGRENGWCLNQVTI